MTESSTLSKYSVSTEIPTIASIEKLAIKLNNDNLSKKNGEHVYQVWDDGEITIQKGGDLLWKRNLHILVFGAPKYCKISINLPHKYGEHSYAFVNQTDANTISDMIRELNDFRPPIVNLL